VGWLGRPRLETGVKNKKKNKKKDKKIKKRKQTVN
jgi:hypothetical protein